MVEYFRDAQQSVGVDAFTAHEVIYSGAVAVQQPRELRVCHAASFECLVDEPSNVQVCVKSLHKRKSVEL